MRVSGFDWDDTNRAKLELHDLVPDDVEALFEAGDPYVFRHPGGRRHIALGIVPDGRFVLVVFEYDLSTRWIRVVTAYEPTNPGWWRKYAQAKGLQR
jgi:uncharacterized DUF497 family protein